MPRSLPLSRGAILLIVGGLILSISTGLRQSFGLFLQPITGLGISTSAFSFAIALQSIIWGLSQPAIGMLADRFGTRAVLIVSALLYAGGVLIMSAAGSTLELDVGTGLLVGLGVAGTNLGVIMGAVARAVPAEKRSQAIGAVAGLGSLGTLLLAPFGQWLIDGFGWRQALVVFAAIASVVVLLAFAIGGRAQEKAGTAAAPADDRTLAEVLREAACHPGYLAMTGAFFACGFQLMFITTHLPSYLAICGLPASLSASAIGLIGFCNAIGTYGVGLLGARYSQKRLLALVYLLRTVFIIAFLALPISPVSLMIFAAAMGFLWLSVAPLVSGLVGRVFGLKHFGTLYGFVFLSHQLGSFCGVLMGGITYDMTGRYDIAWGGLIAIGLIAFLLQWPMDDRTPAERMRGRMLPQGA
jgi:predicted MFS family arabinose efflux permease